MQQNQSNYTTKTERGNKAMMDTKMVKRPAIKLAIEKRDGRSQKYDPAKIKNALIQAVQNTNLSYSKQTIEEITYEVDENIQASAPAVITTSLIDDYVLKRLQSYGML